jgi:uncharacterized protein (DUF58 family)
MIKRITTWLEIHASTPAYSGWVLVGVAVCFFGAGINTMAGWLYVLSGVGFALLSVAAILPPRSLQGLIVKRHPIEPVIAGDDLTVQIEIINPKKQDVILLQITDLLSFVLGKPQKQAIEIIPAQKSYHWIYYQPTVRRGVYRWQTVELASGAPLGLFWCRRQHHCTATAVVYPVVLPLTDCPLIDEIGRENSLRADLSCSRPLQTANEALVRSLRPYRLGDPIRLIHWRTSARYGQLRLRELEMMSGGQDTIIALDSAASWQEENFEQAVITAASLYFYAQRQQIQVQLWTASTGLVRGQRAVLETLAKTNANEDITNECPQRYPLIWLTENPLTLAFLPQGSRWVLWPSTKASSEKVIVNQNQRGVVLQPHQPLQSQLQQTLTTQFVPM